VDESDLPSDIRFAYPSNLPLAEHIPATDGYADQFRSSV
jgi:hypothetical protein